MSTSSRPRRAAGSCVSPPNMTWLILPSCRAAAVSSTGIAVAVNGGPPRAHPVDQSAAVGERQGRAPCAESTISGRVDAGNDPYGCQRTSASMAETSWGSRSGCVSTDAP